MASQKCYVRCY